MTEYLKQTPEEAQDDLELAECLLANHRVFQPHLLATQLQQKVTELVSTPGKHQSQRIAHSEQLIWWVNFFRQLFDQQTAQSGYRTGVYNLVNEVISYRGLTRLDWSKPKTTRGCLFAAGLEGTKGHRWAIDHCLETLGNDDFVLLLGPANYLAQKDRGGRFVSWATGISMWYWYIENQRSRLRFNGQFRLSLIPNLPENCFMNGSLHPIKTDAYFKSVFDQVTGNRPSICFASADDPSLSSKIARGTTRNGAVIPLSPSPSTSEMTSKLMPDLDEPKTTSFEAEKLFEPFSLPHFQTL